MTDLAFALSASGIEANNNFQKMKDIVKSMVVKYGSHKIRYSVIIYGENPSIKLRFSDIFRSDKNLISFIDIIPRTLGVPSLEKALTEAKKVFKESPREKARKVLVVIADKKSGSAPDDVKGKARPLVDAGIKVIPVALGNNADSAELMLTTPDNSSLIVAKSTDKPEDIVDKIIREVSKKGWSLIYLCAPEHLLIV